MKPAGTGHTNVMEGVTLEVLYFSDVSVADDVLVGAQAGVWAGSSEQHSTMFPAGNIGVLGKTLPKWGTYTTRSNERSF